MAKRSKVTVIELQYSGKIYAVTVYRQGDRAYMMGRKKVMNSYSLTSSSKDRIIKILKGSAGFYLYTVLGYKVGEWEPEEGK